LAAPVTQSPLAGRVGWDFRTIDLVTSISDAHVVFVVTALSKFSMISKSELAISKTHFLMDAPPPFDKLSPALILPVFGR
jgi:hypothetical protein